MRFMVRLLGGVAALTVLLVVPTGAPAAVPKAKTQYAVDEHGTAGRNWHVEVEVGKDPRRLKSVVLYLEECGETAFAENVPVSETGEFEVVASLPKGGTWRLTARFPTAAHLHGDFELTNGTCSTGARLFDAHPPSAGGDDEDAGHHSGGTPPGEYPDLEGRTKAQLAEAAGLWSRTLAAAKTGPFRTYTAVRRRYEITAVNRRRPLVFHVFRAAYNTDRYLLSAPRPESLVYWWPRKGRPILVAFMFRSNTLIPPKVAGGIFGWHGHSKTAMPMTHVWLTRNLRSAAAHCMPVPALEAAIPRFRYETPGQPSGPESSRCPEQSR